MINREDMLELTRRMNASRTHLVRLAGAYIDEEGFIDDTFNVNFGNLKGAERTHCLEIAKAIPFAGTNSELKAYRVPGMKAGSIWQLFYALLDCGLKNDALNLTLYEMLAEHYPTGKPYAIYIYYGVYDVPLKGADKSRLGESEEVYSYLIVSVSPQVDEYEAGMPEAGLLYPVFTDRSTDWSHVNVMGRNIVAPWL